MEGRILDGPTKKKFFRALCQCKTIGLSVQIGSDPFEVVATIKKLKAQEGNPDRYRISGSYRKGKEEPVGFTAGYNLRTHMGDIHTSS